jgi:hypothetical protein
MNRRGFYLGVLSIKDNSRRISAKDARDYLAGAEHSGKTQGPTRRTELAGVQALEVTRRAGGKVWIVIVERYFVLVAGTAKEADDVVMQLAVLLKR